MHTNVHGGDSCAKVPAKNIQREARKCLRLQSLDCTMRMRGDFEPTVDERETCGIFAETSVAKTLARVWGLSGSPRYKPFQCVADCVPDQLLIAEVQCLTPVSNPDSVKGGRFPTSPRFRDANSAPVQILADPLQHRVLTPTARALPPARVVPSDGLGDGLVPLNLCLIPMPPGCRTSSIDMLLGDHLFS